MSADTEPLLIPFFGGPFDGEVFRCASGAPAEQLVRSHRTGAGAVRTVYLLAVCECHGPTYLFARNSERMIDSYE